MVTNSLIRLAQADDGAQVHGIYAPVVCNTPISFEVEPPSVEEMQQRIQKTLPQFPWLVCEHQGEVIGYVYATSHNSREAYLWSVNVSVYIHPQWHRVGVGKALYSSLFEVLKLQGFYNAFAGVTLPNAGSVGLHEALGFRRVGIYESVGYKFGLWHSTGWWQLELKERSATPSLPLSIDEVKGLELWHGALEKGLPLLKL